MILSSVVALIFLVAATVISVVSEKRKNKIADLFGWTKIMIFGVFVAGFTMYLPVWLSFFAKEGKSAVMAVMVSLHSAARLFMIDGEFSFVMEQTASEGVVATLYYILFAIIYIVAPLLTFGFVLSFFKNASAYAKLFLRRKSEIYVFSELNEKSLALAKSIKSKADAEKRKTVFVFSDVFESEEEEKYEFIHEAKHMNAICFKKDIVTIDFSVCAKGAPLNFFIIGEDADENIGQALKIGERYKYTENTNMYVFSTHIESEFLMSNLLRTDKSGDRKVHMKIRRVDEVYSLITRNLYETGYENIFASAVEEEDGAKWINALIVGMGQHGTQMTKALSWFCQMDGYRLRLNAFDTDANAEKRFVALCPELMDDKYNHHFYLEEEAGYSISIHSDVDVESADFYDMVKNLPQQTYIFVALGDDEKNVKTALGLRSYLARMGQYPVIQAIVYNEEKKEALTGIRNFSGQEYNVDFIGDISTSYSESVVMGSDIEKMALARHMLWGEENSFWQYDYNRKSSVASAIHRQMKMKCGIPGAEKDKAERTDEERQIIRVLEHKRWNAYMRSEGFVYGEVRNNLAKVHPLLVPFYKLPEEQKLKDDD